MNEKDNKKTLFLVILTFLFGIAVGYYLCKYRLTLPKLILPTPTPTSSSTPTATPTLFNVNQPTATPTSTPTPTFIPPGLQKK